MRTLAEINCLLSHREALQELDREKILDDALKSIKCPKCKIKTRIPYEVYYFIVKRGIEPIKQQHIVCECCNFEYDVKINVL
jgi:hypothetical protein